MFTKYKEKAGVYFFCSRLFREPVDKGLLATILEQKLLTQVYYFSKENPLEASQYLEQDSWLKMVNDIALEYTTLFVLSGEKSILPYESYYCDTIPIDTSTADSEYFCAQFLSFGDGNKVKGLISGPSTMSVRQSYIQEGYSLSPYYLPDHIACELEFIGQLYNQKKVSLVKDFFENHLNHWAPLFLNKLKNQSVSDFYRALAVSLEEFMRSEKFELRDMTH